MSPTKQPLLLIAAISAALLSCSRSSVQEVAPAGHVADSLATSNPFDAAIAIATEYGRSMDHPLREQAMAICLDLLEMDEARADTQKSADRRLSVLRVLTETYRNKRDMEN